MLHALYEVFVTRCEAPLGDVVRAFDVSRGFCRVPGSTLS